MLVNLQNFRDQKAEAVAASLEATAAQTLRYANLDLFLREILDDLLAA